MPALEGEQLNHFVDALTPTLMAALCLEKMDFAIQSVNTENVAALMICTAIATVANQTNRPEEIDFQQRAIELAHGSNFHIDIILQTDGPTLFSISPRTKDSERLIQPALVIFINPATKNLTLIRPGITQEYVCFQALPADQPYSFEEAIVSAVKMLMTDDSKLQSVSKTTGNLNREQNRIITSFEYTSSILNQSI